MRRAVRTRSDEYLSAPFKAEPPKDAATNGAWTTGILLANLKFRPTHTSDVAAEILTYPDDPRAISDLRGFLQNRIRAIVNVDHFTADTGTATFLSGRRRYSCRPFLLESSEHPPRVALLLERRPRDSVQVADIGRRFHLSPREFETVRHLVHGLTTKEIAERMRVSPNTIKQFVRIIMSKMGVATRSGVIGKLIAG